MLASEIWATMTDDERADVRAITNSLLDGPHLPGWEGVPYTEEQKEVARCWAAYGALFMVWADRKRNGQGAK